MTSKELETFETLVREWEDDNEIGMAEDERELAHMFYSLGRDHPRHPAPDSVPMYKIPALPVDPEIDAAVDQAVARARGAESKLTPIPSGDSVPRSAPTDSGIEELDALCAKFNAGEIDLCKLVCDAWNKALFLGGQDATPADSVPRELGWLLELPGPTYLGEQEDGVLGWTSDHMKALRFAREEDAEMYMTLEGLTRPKAIEHEWSDYRKWEEGK